MNPEYHDQVRVPRSRIHSGLALALVMLFAGCGGGDGGTQSPPPSPSPPPPPPAPQNLSGLDARPSNKTCIAPERPTGSTTIGTQQVYPALALRYANHPISLQQSPGDGSRWFVVEQEGFVRVFDNKPDVTSASLVIDLSSRVENTCAECGLLGLAFHPDFPATPRVYLFYTSTHYSSLGGPDSVLSEFTTHDGGLTLDPASERVILTLNKPKVHHHGGRIAFGPDGFLYVGTGDGNSYAIDNGQTLTNVLGKILRIDISGTTGSALYKIPADNPFAANALCSANGYGSQNCPELYAWGFRNPWGWSFDRQTGDLWVGDVGESEIEEVNKVKRGGNYGWRCFEGTKDTSARWPSGASCGTKTNLQPPVAQYSHSIGRAVTGGYVYRGKAIPGLVGRYVFGDFVTGLIFDIPNDTKPTKELTAGLETAMNISTFAEDQDGELYFVHMYGGIYRITGADAGGGGAGPATQLSATGCVDASNATLPASGLIPYAPHAPFWSDGAAKERWIGLPDGQNITVGADGDFDFPNGTVLMKNFRLDNRLVETRLFMRHPDGIWAGYTYEWNDAQTDATLVHGGKQVTVAGQTWIYPSEGQCMECHTEAAGRSLGLESRQLAFNIKYPQTGRDAHQLVTLNEINTLTSPIADPTDLVPYPDPQGTSGTLSERARSYLHTNCSQCHRPNGPTTSTMDLRYATALADTHACDVAPTVGDLGITDARLIAPGAAARSVLIARMSRRDAHGMPPLGSAKVDEEGAKLLTDWVNSLTSCN
ncbi:MAG TPA: PQQ-dependent sugar dehydrogenase [Burkholderiales bacterium]|jgi:uncharacterized repeat protein (TIGR03806 family)|nr:PQQ-dependent sugar dehydrogenase [Burkholderiales bacterium]